MKYKNILIIMIITILFTGCSASKKDELLNEGKLALERHEYTNVPYIVPIYYNKNNVYLLNLYNLLL